MDTDLWVSYHCVCHSWVNILTQLTEVPNTNRPSAILDATVNSPRRNLINQAAAFTLKEHVAAPARWQHFKQPLPLILQTFQEMTEKNEDFWFKACGYFKKRQYPAGAVIFTRGVCFPIRFSFYGPTLIVTRPNLTDFIFWRMGCSGRITI